MVFCVSLPNSRIELLSLMLMVLAASATRFGSTLNVSVSELPTAWRSVDTVVSSPWLVGATTSGATVSMISASCT